MINKTKFPLVYSQKNKANIDRLIDKAFGDTYSFMDMEIKDMTAFEKLTRLTNKNWRNAGFQHPKKAAKSNMFHYKQYDRTEIHSYKLIRVYKGYSHERESMKLFWIWVKD